MSKHSRSPSPPNTDTIQPPRKKPIPRVKAEPTPTPPTLGGEASKDADPGPSTSASANATNNAGLSFHYTDVNGDVQPTFYFDSGVVVLKTQDEPPSLFQASQAILAKESPVFKEMFAPDKLAGYELHNGHPLVVVEDTSQDIQHFLSATHYYRDYFENPDWHNLDQIYSILRTSTKYKVNHLSAKMVVDLTDDFPTSLKDFDRSRKDGTQWEWTLPQYFQCFDAAREANARRLLPLLYYYCSGTPTISDIQEARVCPAKCIADTQDDEECFFSHPRDKTLCLKGREAIMVRASKMIYGIGFHEVEPCQTRGECLTKKVEWAKETIDLPGFLQLPLDADLSSRLLGLTLCDDCLKAMSSLVRKARQEFWSELPRIFGLGDSWEELLQEDA